MDLLITLGTILVGLLISGIVIKGIATIIAIILELKGK